MKLSVLIASIALVCADHAFAQSSLQNPVDWSAKIVSEKGGPTLQITAKLQAGWHIFSQYQSSEGPTATRIQFTPSASYQLVGKTTEPVSITYYEKLFKTDVKYFEKQVQFQQKIRWMSKPTPITAKIEFMACRAKECLPPDEIELLITPNL